MNVLSKFDLSTNIALVTGGAGLLGLQHCEALLEAGSKVVILDIDKNAIKRYEEAFSSKYKNKIYALHTDITSEVEIISAKENIYKKFNAFPSILINNAAIDAKYETDNKINATRLEDFALDQWNMEVSVGLSGAFLCSKHFGTEMARGWKGGNS